MSRALVLLVISAATLASGCSLDSFLFSPRRVDGYRWDEIDPSLDGELTEDHPSIVPASDRTEGFLDAGGNEIHWVYAHRDAAIATVVYSHGRSRNLGRYWDRVERLWEHGYSVLIYDYPGFGRSTGSPDEPGVMAAARGALDLVITLPDVDPDRIVLLGYSLGGGPTYELAALAARGEAPAVRAVISESTFCSVAALVEDGSFLDLAPGYFAESRFDNCARIAELAVPVLLIHGRADDFVVFRNAEMLRDAAMAAPTTLFVEGAQHSDVPLIAGDAYDRAIDDHIAAALAGP